MIFGAGFGVAGAFRVTAPVHEFVRRFLGRLSAELVRTRAARECIMHRIFVGGVIAVALCACGGVTTRQNQPSLEHPGIPRMTVERLQQCVADYSNQLPPGSWTFRPTITVDQYGRFVDVHAGGIPNTAPDLAACTRDAWSDMTIPESAFTMRTTQPPHEQTAEQRALVGNPGVVVVVIVVAEVGEIVLEAGAITILFATTVKVVEKAADDVLDAAKRWRPTPNKNRCLDAAAGGTYLWEEFCRSMKEPGNCWSKTYESEQNKRGWCNERFGN